MNCRDKKVKKYLDDEGLLFYTQALYNGIAAQIQNEIEKAVVQKTLASNPAIIEKIDEMLENGDLATNQALNANVRQLKELIEQAKDDAVANAIAQFNTNLRTLARRYAQELVDEVVEDGLGNIDTNDIVDALMSNAAFKNQFVKKAGDTMTGALTVEGNITGAKFVTSSGITFF